MNTAILTGGGDCPGLNAVIRAVSRKLLASRDGKILGVRNGWRGMLESDLFELTPAKSDEILAKGGTVLGTSRTNPVKEEGGLEAVLKTIESQEIDAVVAIGGDDTLGVARQLYEKHKVRIVGVPKTIDNDLSGTDYTFGFDTAVHIATEAIDRLHTTAASHSRVMVVELMGRSTGWIAIMAGIAGGAHAIMIPEFPATLEDVCDQIQSHREQGHNYALVVVSEGVKLLHRSGETKEVTASQEKDAFGHARLGGVGNQLSSAIEERTGLETRAAVLGHIQRGGTPTAHDRILATRYGVKTAEMILSGEWGRMAALKGDQVEAIPLEAAVDELKKVPEDLYQMAQIFCG